jgi:1-acyl-sn-glycerol-3-phosphate acyltransferase
MSDTSIKSLDSYGDSTFRPLRLFWTISSYWVFAIGAGALSWLILPPVWCLGGSLFERRRRCQSVVSAALRFFHWYMRVAGLIDFDAAKAMSRLSELVSEHGPVVMIANHPTLVDTTALLASVKHLCCISKPGFYHNPLLYPLVLFCGHINTGNKSNTASSRALVETAVARLEAGHSLLIFPEGTRSPSYGLGAFHRGAFEIALRARVPVQPVLIEVSRPILNRELPWYWMPNESVRYSISKLPVIAPPEGPPKARTSRKLSEEMWNQYEVRLGLYRGNPV